MRENTPIPLEFDGNNWVYTINKNVLSSKESLLGIDLFSSLTIDKTFYTSEFFSKYKTFDDSLMEFTYMQS